MLLKHWSCDDRQLKVSCSVDVISMYRLSLLLLLQTTMDGQTQFHGRDEITGHLSI